MDGQTIPADGSARDYKNPPERIYLQWHGDTDPRESAGPVSETDVSWCWHRIHVHDIEYVRGCARDQRTTQYCAEPATAHKRIADLEAELADARLDLAIADGTATPDMLREAGLLDGWVVSSGDYKGQGQADLDVGGVAARVYRDGSGHGQVTCPRLAHASIIRETSRVRAVRAADAQARKLLDRLATTGGDA